jgi:hypothetical protein
LGGGAKQVGWWWSDIPMFFTFSFSFLVPLLFSNLVAALLSVTFCFPC